MLFVKDRIATLFLTLFSLALLLSPTTVLAEDGDGTPSQPSASQPAPPNSPTPPATAPPQTTVLVVTTEELSRAVSAYTGGGYEAINSSRRGTSWRNMLYTPESAQSLGETLESGVRQSRPFSGTLYRTADREYFDPTPGATNTDPGFWSFSDSPDYPSRIASGRSEMGTDVVIMSMSVTEDDGYPTLNVNSMGHSSNFPTESEQIGPPGTSVRVISATQDPEDPRITYVEVEPVSPTPRVSAPSPRMSLGTRVRSGVSATVDSMGPASATEMIIETVTGTDIIPEGTSDVVDTAYEAARSNPGSMSQLRSMAQSTRSSLGNAASSIRSQAVSTVQQATSFIRSRPRESAAATATATEVARSQGTRMVISNSARTLLSGASVPSASTAATVAVPSAVVGTSGYVIYRDISMFTDPDDPSNQSWAEYRYKSLDDYNKGTERALTEMEEATGFWESIWAGFSSSASQMETIPGWSIYP